MSGNENVDELRRRVTKLESRLPDSDGKFRLACVECGKVIVTKSLEQSKWFLCEGRDPDRCRAVTVGGVRRVQSAATSDRNISSP